MFKRILPSAIAISCGLIVLLGFVLPVDFLIIPRRLLIQWAMILGAFAFILAYASILRVHLTRLTQGHKHRIASLLIIISTLGTLGLVIWQGPNGAAPQYLLQHVMVPGESALLALTAVTLLLAGMRVLLNRRNPGSVVFVILTALALLMTVPYAGFGMRFFETLRKWIQIPALAGMRGIVLGVALGITLTGLRIIFGADRPYSEG